MIKVRIIYADTADKLQNEVNTFLEKDIRVVSVTSFGVGTGVKYLYTQIIYIEGTTGSKFVEQPKNPFVYTEPSVLSETRQE